MNKISKILVISIIIIFSINDCKKSPTDSNDAKAYTYYEGQQIPNTEVFVPMEKYGGIDQPIVSHDGQSILYYKFYTPRDSFGLYLKNLLTNKERFLVKDGQYADWSPDGEWIAFGIYPQIYKIKINGDSLIQLTTGEGSFQPVWSPDGKYLCFGGNTSYNIMNSNGTEKKKIGDQYFGAPSDWHPSGTKLLGIRGYSATSIWSQFPILDIGTNTTERILNAVEGFSNSFAYYSPDGSRIVFFNEKGIWIMNSDGTAVKRLLPNDLSPDRFPDYSGGIKLLVGRASWYQDGKYLIYTHFKVTRYTIIQEPTTGSSVRVEGYMSFYKVNIDSAISISNLP